MFHLKLSGNATGDDFARRRAKIMAHRALARLRLPVSALAAVDESAAHAYVSAHLSPSDKSFEPAVLALVAMANKLASCPTQVVACTFSEKPEPETLAKPSFWAALHSRVAELTEAVGAAFAETYEDRGGRLVVVYHLLAEEPGRGLAPVPRDPEDKITIVEKDRAPSRKPAPVVSHSNHAYLEIDTGAPRPQVVSVSFEGHHALHDVVRTQEGVAVVLTRLSDTTDTGNTLIVDWDARLVSPFLVHQKLVDDRGLIASRHMRTTDLTGAGKIVKAALDPIVAQHLLRHGAACGTYRITEIDDREVCDTETLLADLSVVRSTVGRGLPSLLVSHWSGDISEIINKLGAHFGNTPAECGPASPCYDVIARLVWACIVARFVEEEAGVHAWMRVMDFVASEELINHPGRVVLGGGRKRRRV